jgi:heme oxygenase
LLTNSVTLQQYGNALAALHGIYSQAESWIFDYLQQHPTPFDYGPRRKLPKLESDLTAIGRAPGVSNVVFSPKKTMGALAGILYTIEGSTLGGQVIARLLRQSDSTAQASMLFFSGYGDETHQMWTRLMAFLDTHCLPSDYQPAQDSAVSLFSAIKTHLDQVVL